MGSGALCFPPFQYNNNKVSKYISDGDCDIDSLCEFLPNNIINNTVNVLLVDPNEQEYSIWITSKDGNFSTKDAYKS